MAWSLAHGWVVGVFLAALASFISNFGVTLQKLQHVRLAHKSEREKEAYATHFMWRLGFFLVVFGSFADFAALSFAPQSLIAPLGSLTLVSNVIFAPLLLNEPVYAQSVFATVTIIAGSSISVAFASHEDVSYTILELFAFYTRPAFALYMSLVAAYLIFCIWAIRFFEHLEATEKSGARYLRLQPYHRLCYPAASGAIGAQSVLFAKCSVELLRNTFEGHGLLLSYYQTYFVIIAMFVCIFLQIRWLNEGLKRFDASYTVPVFTAFWILLSVISGLIFYREYLGMSEWQMTMFFFGVILTISGVAMLSRRKMSPRVESINLSPIPTRVHTNGTLNLDHDIDHDNDESVNHHVLGMMIEDEGVHSLSLSSPNSASHATTTISTSTQVSLASPLHDDDAHDHESAPLVLPRVPSSSSSNIPTAAAISSPLSQPNSLTHLTHAHSHILSSTPLSTRSPLKLKV